MVVVVAETGAGLPAANSYVSGAAADDYFAGHPFYADAWEDLPADRRALLLVAATRSLDAQYVWAGWRATLTQALDWPRTGVRDLYDLPIPANVVPLRLAQATCEHAYYLTKGDKTADAGASGALDKLRIDVIELDFSSATAVSSASAAVNVTVQGLLRGLGDYSAGSRVRRVVVG